MNKGTFNPVSFYALAVESSDLELFDMANDLPLINTAMAFDQQRIDAAIERAARQAQLQSDAESSLLLASLFKDDVYRHLEHLERAEAAAFALGALSYQPRRSASSPFADIALATAWNNGYSDAALKAIELPDNALDAKLWNEGIDTETGDTLYELAALALLRLADIGASHHVCARAHRLAQEMLAYHQGASPSPRRQQEIDRFMRLQTQRLAATIDFTDF